MLTIKVIAPIQHEILLKCDFQLNAFILICDRFLNLVINRDVAEKVSNLKYYISD